VLWIEFSLFSSALPLHVCLSHKDGCYSLS
jgi:hypothetical protein